MLLYFLSLLNKRLGAVSLNVWSCYSISSMLSFFFPLSNEEKSYVEKLKRRKGWGGLAVQYTWHSQLFSGESEQVFNSASELRARLNNLLIGSRITAECEEGFLTDIGRGRSNFDLRWWIFKQKIIELRTKKNHLWWRVVLIGLKQRDIFNLSFLNYF